MKKTIRVQLSVESIEDAMQQLTEYRNSLTAKAAKIADRLSDIGFDVSSGILLGHIYTGETISSLNVTQVGPSKWIISAGSTALLFLEFGAGLVGHGHPKPGIYGPGTWSFGPGGKGHAFDPNGWWFQTDDPQLAIRQTKGGRMYGHSHGNPPYMPMYQASVEMRRKIEQVAREVFSESD